ncbi:MAG TPA: efflux RND transporter periplasmic adaptor subunit [Polyangiaceae bacterium]|nr:efflux RND transporter periplasmic adaptor subunit [Polyangiaceae bacterium]
MTSRAGEHETMKDPNDAELGFELAKPARWSTGRVLAMLLVAIAAFAGLFAFAYLPRRAARETLVKEATARAEDVPRVTFVKPRLVSSARTLDLPGSVQPLEEAVIYARASGYVRRWAVDIGSRVKQGELLAEIDTPELDQELAQARAALAQARANVLQANANQGLNVTRLDRTGKLVEAGLSPSQDLDQTQAQSVVGEADVKVAEANVAAQQANIRRISDLKGFSRVTAPFAGTITERSIDRGSLVAAGNVASPLFKLASTDTVRVYVQVPQDAAPSITLDEPAELGIREFPNEKFKGKVARTAGALDSATRTLSTEVRVPNPDGRLLAGMYADVALSLPSARRVFELPATSLLNDAAGLRIALVGTGDKVHLQPIVLERDLGATVQVASGLEGDERVIQVAGVEFEEGQAVKPVAAPAPTASATVSTPAPVVVPPSVVGSSAVVSAPSAVPAPR